MLFVPSVRLPRIGHIASRSLAAAALAAVAATTLLAPSASAAPLLREPVILTDDPTMGEYYAPARTHVRPQPIPVKEYQVQPGDSLQAIAHKFGLDTLTLVGANPVLADDPHRIAIGTKLQILPTKGVVVTALDGDSISSLAQKFSVDSGRAAEANRIPDKSPLRAGDKVLLPDARPEVALAFAKLDGLEAAAVPGARALSTTFEPIWPTRGEMTSYFGELHDTSPRGHAGIDLAAATGTPIVAADGGEVLKAYHDSAYGNLVVIAHASGFETWYAHLDTLAVSAGEPVQRGQHIGTMGNTGYSFGSHLHFEVRENGQLRDPMRYLP